MSDQSSEAPGKARHWREEVDEEEHRRYEESRERYQDDRRQAHFREVSAVQVEDGKSYRALRRLIGEIASEAFGKVSSDDESGSEALRERVKDALDPLIKSVILSTLGIRVEWNEVRITEDGPLGRALKERVVAQATTVVTQWLDKNGWPSLRQHEKALRSRANEFVARALTQRLETLINQRVSAIPNDALLPLIDEVLFAKYPVLRRMEALTRLAGDDADTVGRE